MIVTYLTRLCMKTKPLYLEDPYLKEIDATILDVILEKEGVWKIILDQTVFYPMGGGQPTDQGFFVFPDGTKGEVYQVMLKEGEINHYVKMASAPMPGQRLKGAINWERRHKNMKVHTAGHLIDFALYLLGYSPKPLLPDRADHGKKPFVHFMGRVDKDITKELQDKVIELIQKNLRFSWSFESLEDLEKEALYLQPNLPKNKPLRALRLEGVATVADGGTIMASTSEIGKVIILPIERCASETYVYYQVE